MLPCHVAFYQPPRCPSRVFKSAKIAILSVFTRRFPLFLFNGPFLKNPFAGGDTNAIRDVMRLRSVQLHRQRGQEDNPQGDRSSPRQQARSIPVSTHHSITRLCEAQANVSIVREIARHVSPKMLAHYSHGRLDAKRRALDALSPKPSEAGSGGGGFLSH